MMSARVVEDQMTVYVYQPVNTHVTATLEFSKYRLQKKPDEYFSRVYRNRAKQSKRMNAQMKTVVFKALSDFCNIKFKEFQFRWQ